MRRPCCTYSKVFVVLLSFSSAIVVSLSLWDIHQKQEFVSARLRPTSHHDIRDGRHHGINASEFVFWFSFVQLPNPQHNTKRREAIAYILIC